jgi:serine kinase of HPr protein (carbohydrate metabolism regulator)
LRRIPSPPAFVFATLDLTMPVLIHATSVHVPGLGGALITGASGAGKSDLGLRLIDEGALLVADDQSALSIENDHLIARAPSAITGLIEVRGIGIIAVPTIAATRIDAVFALVSPESIERLPAPRSFALPSQLAAATVKIPLFELAPFEASATAKLRAAIAGVSGLFRHETGRN